MRRFNYKAKDKTGQIITGEVEASSDNQAAKLVRERGLVVITIVPRTEGIFSIVRKMRDKITLKDISTFTRKLSTMINAGLPITESLLVLRNQSKGSLQKVVSQMLADVEGGESLSAAAEKHPKVFNPTYVALLKSGEVGGVIDKVLVRLADNLESQEEFKGKVKGALIYPIIIVVGMVIVSLIMMIFVIPKLMALYKDFNAELPLPTRILMGISNFAFNYWPVFIVLGFVIIYGIRVYRKTQIGRRKTDELIFKIPIIGELQKQTMLTELTQTLSLMVGSGVSILEALNISADIMGNVVISDALRQAAKDVEKGFPVAYSFAKHPAAFPYILSQMIAVGEETGKMDEVLQKVSHVFEVESDQREKALTAAVDPLIRVVLALGVGFLVIAVILPIYN